MREHLFRYSTKLGLSAQRLLPANTAASHRSLLLVTFRVHRRGGWGGGALRSVCIQRLQPLRNKSHEGCLSFTLIYSP